MEGGCLCGAVRYRITKPTALDSGYCHCRMCQRNSGAPVNAYASFDSAGFAWTAEAPAVYASSERGRRMFCPHCGSYLAFQYADRPEQMTVNTTSLDDPDAVPPRRHIYTESRRPWFETADDLPRLPRD